MGRPAPLCRFRIAPSSAVAKILVMSIQQLKAEAAGLSDAQRRELIGYLVTVGREHAPAYWERLAAKIEDRDPAHWVREEDLDRALDLDQPGA